MALNDRRAGTRATGLGSAPGVIGSGASGPGIYGESVSGPGLQGEGLTDVAARLTREAASATGVVNVLELNRKVLDAAPTAGVGMGMLWQQENSDGELASILKLQSTWSVLGASRKSLTSLLCYGASTYIEALRAEFNGTAFRLSAPGLAPTAVQTADKLHGDGPAWSTWTWANADVVAAGAVLSLDIKLCTLPAGTIVHRALLKVGTQATGGLSTLTGSVGAVGTDYTDYVKAAALDAAAGTIYGDAVAEVGASLSLHSGVALGDYYYAAATDVYLQIVGTHASKTLADVLTCSGTVALLTSRPF